jgi:type VI protein secretion system component VasK
MEPPLPEVIAWRFVLAALPFAAWFIWRAWAIRSGHPMGSTPWVWLFAAAAVLFAASLLVAVLLHPDNSHARYVPGEVTPGGAVTAGHFEKKPQ